MLTAKFHTIHLIGICGTAMASLASMLQDKGYAVTGSDQDVYPPMSVFLSQKNITVFKGYDARNLQTRPDMVVVGNALSRCNPEIEHVLNSRIPYISLPEALKHFFLRGKTPVVVTGTHGKTTTTSMIAWGLHEAGLNPDFFIGGIAENFDSSYGLQGGDHCVVEGDEYDSAFFDKGPKFLHYLPYAAIIGNIEFDHADIYTDLEAIKLQFRRFVNLVPQNGFLAVGGDSPAASEVGKYCFGKTETFGMGSSNDWSPENIAIEDQRTCFDIRYRGNFFGRLQLGVYGNYNVLKAMAATAVMNYLGVPAGSILESLASFRGVRRRLQHRATVGDIRIYEDFAHHPTAVGETLKTVKEVFNPKRLWAIYEPRSATSRRKVFQDAIAHSLSLADCIAVPELFKPGKIPVEERLDLGRLRDVLAGMGRKVWNLTTVEDVINKVCEEALPGDLIVIMSNGG
ncbi:MAG: UDP-N-acetylmuramate:L-alanyl-gamma-D-glutamyl-meso-diaminopimelate ligase, partial [Acidobacteriota bacterium]